MLLQDLPPLPPALRDRVDWARPTETPGADFERMRDSLHQDQLLALGFPVRPDREKAPRLYRFWQAMAQSGFAYVEPDLALDPTVVHRSADSGAIAGSFRTRWGRSRNWSGAVLAARDGKLFSSVAASWKVPAAEGVAGDTVASLPGGNRQVSVWIGLDGHRRYSLSLPQVGTRSLVRPLADGTLRDEYHLWVQWWVRDELFGEIPVRNFTVDKGHEIHAKLDVLAPTSVVFTVVNRTTQQRVSATWAAGEYQGVIAGTMDVGPQSPANLIRTLAPVEGRHAVFCVERPSVLPQAAPNTPKEELLKLIEPYDLPRFGHGVFREMLAEMLDPASPGNTAEERDLTAARYLRMVDEASGEAPPRTRWLASPVPAAKADASSAAAALDPLVVGQGE